MGFAVELADTGTDELFVGSKVVGTLPEVVEFANTEVLMFVGEEEEFPEKVGDDEGVYGTEEVVIDEEAFPENVGVDDGTSTEELALVVTTDDELLLGDGKPDTTEFVLVEDEEVIPGFELQG